MMTNSQPRKFKIEIELEHDEQETGFHIGSFERQQAVAHLMEDVTGGVFMNGAMITSVSMKETTAA